MKEYADWMNMENDAARAGRILVAILHALRDVITPEESMQLIAQFPMFLKSVYINGWSLSKKKPKVKKMEDFLALIREHDWPAAPNDFEWSDELTERYLNTTLIFLRNYVSSGELEDIRDILPTELKSIIQ